MKTVTRDVAKNSYEIVRAQTSVWEGRELIDIRVYAIPQSLQATTREFCPTKRGVNLPVDRLSDLIAALEEIRRELDGEPCDEEQDV